MSGIRNVAIIAHVDHGKTTLVSTILNYCLAYKGDDDADGVNPVLDNQDLERERGITIVSKNVAVKYKDTKINLIDTPGHADFGGEVERVLNMADGVLLLVDAFEGPMPQTRFVLQKAIDMKLKPCVVINKVDKPNCTPQEVHEKVFDLMFELGAEEWQLDFPVVYGSAKQQWMGEDWTKPTEDIDALMQMIVNEIPEPKVEEGSMQMLVTSLDYSSYTGRIAIGRLQRGVLKEGMQVALIDRDENIVKSRIKELYLFEGMGRVRVQEVKAGDICAIVGLENFEIGDTIADIEHPEAMESIAIDEPTMSMLFTINDSPFFGKDGKYVTSRHIKERLDKELERNLALKVEAPTPDRFIVSGRGIMHLAVLIETMRREGYELQIGQPQVIIKEVDGVKCEPFEELTVDLPEDLSGKAVELVTQRRGELLKMEARNGRVISEFIISSRGLIGLRNQLLTATAGEAVMAHRFKEFKPMREDIPGRLNGSLVSMETGTAITYSIDKLQDRGTFFVDPGEEIYEGQVIGQNTRQDDIVVNITKTKKLTNVRASGTDDKANIAPAVKFSLEEALEYIQKDEYVEVTPNHLRIRKIYLKEFERKRHKSE